VVAKDDARVEAYGTVDELNAVLGMVRALNDGASAPAEAVATIDGFLQTLQNDLFNVGGDLATRAGDRWEGMVQVGDLEVGRLEEWCDALNEELGPLKEFILPGGGAVGATLHHARTVCRRAERRVYTLMRSEADIGEGCLRYLNRLSDFLFVLARWSARAYGEIELFWDKPAAERKPDP